MKLLFDQQDIIDAVCVKVAADENDGWVEESHPELVTNIVVNFDQKIGFSAKAKFGIIPYKLNQQQLIDAITLYLSAYYSFAVERILVDLIYFEDQNVVGAEIVIQR